MHDCRAHQCRHLDEGVARRAAGFEQADTRAGVLRKARGEYAPGRSCANDDVVELGVDRHGFFACGDRGLSAPAKRQRQQK